MDVEVMVDVRIEHESSPEPGTGAGAGAGEPAGESPAGAASVLDGMAIAVGTLEKSLPVSGEEDSAGTGLTVTTKTLVAVGRTEVASTDDGDSMGEPPKSVPLCGAVPLVMG
jgi:hypothetical protein